MTMDQDDDRHEVLKKYIRRRICYGDAFNSLINEGWNKGEAEIYLKGVNDVLSLDKKIVILMLTEWELVCRVLEKCAEKLTFEECPNKGHLHETLGKIQQQITE